MLQRGVLNSGERPRWTHSFKLRLNFNFCTVFLLPVSLVPILILVNMPTTSTSALKKTNQELKAQISVLFGEIENLKSQLGVNADDESAAAAAATTATTATAIATATRPTISHKRTQRLPVCSDLCRGRAQAVKRSERSSYPSERES